MRNPVREFGFASQSHMVAQLPRETGGDFGRRERRFKRRHRAECTLPERVPHSSRTTFLPRPAWLMGPRLGTAILLTTWLIGGVSGHGVSRPTHSPVLGLLEALFTRPSEPLVFTTFALSAVGGAALTVFAVLTSAFRAVPFAMAPWVALCQWSTLAVSLPWLIALGFVVVTLLLASAVIVFLVGALIALARA